MFNGAYFIGKNGGREPYDNQLKKSYSSLTQDSYLGQYSTQRTITPYSFLFQNSSAEAERSLSTSKSWTAVEFEYAVCQNLIALVQTLKCNDELMPDVGKEILI